MATGEKVQHGIAVCNNCGTIQPVEVCPEEGIRAMGNPACECGDNDFRMVE
jgi:Fe2+ or Zn2+ uptake regulation protein